MSPLLLLFGLIASAQSPLERVMPVTQVTGILVDARAGRIDVQASTRPDMHVKANVPFTIEPDGSGLRIRAADVRAVQEVVFDIEVPRTMAVRATGWLTDITISGVGGDVRVDSHEGAIEIRGGNGATTVHSVSGRVSVSGRTGSVTVMAAASDVTLQDVAGQITVDGTSGAVRLAGVRSSMLEAQTVSGDIAFSGTILENGQYTLTSHKGAVGLMLPRGTGATLTTFSGKGGLEATPALVPVAVEPGKLTKRVYRIGDGSGRIEVRTLNGRLTLGWSEK
jgi:hypothetical protein